MESFFFDTTFKFYEQSTDWTVFAFQKIDSTNNEAKKISSLNQPPHFFLAKSQTQGRGQGENTWLDVNKGGQLFATWSEQWPTPPQPHLTLVIGLALYKALKKNWPQLIHLNIKPPNDIYIGNKKIGGILTESLQQGSLYRLIIGLGLNITEKPSLEIATDLISSVTEIESIKRNWISFLSDWEAFRKIELLKNIKTLHPGTKTELESLFIKVPTNN